jgi:hypothetical protein
MPSALRADGRSAEEVRHAIESFLSNCREPALLEPGEEVIPLTNDNFSLEFRSSRLTFQAWDRTRNLTRRIVGIRKASTARLELLVEHFGRREGQMFLLDLSRRAGQETGRRSARLIFRERFRMFVRRQFPEWSLVEISTEPNLEFSLSPVFPRAFLRSGQHGWAAIACPPESDPGEMVSFGLIWLSYLRTRERRIAIDGLAFYVPQGREQTAALRVLCLNPHSARFEIFAYSPEDYIGHVDPRDHGNLDTRLERCRSILPEERDTWRGILEVPGVEFVPKHNGTASLRVRGLEFAEIAGPDLRFGAAERRPANRHQLKEVQLLAGELDRTRSAGAVDREHPLYRRNPEAWLESMVRANIEAIDAALLRTPIYGQVPAFAGGERGVLDLLAVDYSGRLTIVELKATADLHLPLQALDYWIRVKWHLDRGEFSPNGYFPGLELRPEAPRLLLVSPSLEFHPSTESILGFYSPAIEVERVGLGVEWRRGLEAMFRLRGAERPR